MKAGKIYFVLYIVIIVELLVVITERDRLLNEASEKIGKFKVINQQYEQKLTLEIPQKTRNFVVPYQEELRKTNYFVSNLIPSGLVSKSEQDSIEYIAELTEESQRNFFWLPKRISSNDKEINPNFYISRSEVGGISNLFLRFTWPEILGKNQRIANQISQPGGYAPLNLKLFFQTPRIIDTSFDAQTMSLILESIGDSANGNAGQYDKIRLSYIYGIQDSTLSDILLKLNLESNKIRAKYLFGFDYNSLASRIEDYRKTTSELRDKISETNREILNLVETREENSKDESLSDDEKQREEESLNVRISDLSKVLTDLKSGLFVYQQDICNYYRTSVTDSFLSNFSNEEDRTKNRDDLIRAKSDTVNLEIRIRNR